MAEPEILPKSDHLLDERIPQEYQAFWQPYESNKTLFHLTTINNLEEIKKAGYVEPRDPAPRNWAGMKSIFMADPDDPIYHDSLPNVLAHAKKKGDQLVRLHINTKNRLYRSIDPERTFQVMSLDPISVDDITDIEEVG